jgi:hypothetical protein
MSPVDLAQEMAAARQRHAEKTAKAIRDARVVAVRAVARPGSTPEEIEAVVRSFYPRLSQELVEEVTAHVAAGNGFAARAEAKAAREAEAAAAGEEVADEAAEASAAG